MIAAFKMRKPWSTAIITLIFGAVVGMCFINRGRLALAYFGISILLAGLLFPAAEIGLLPIHPVDALGIVGWGINIMGAIHGFIIAKQYHYSEPLNWYSRWYSLIAIIIIPMLIVFAFRHFCYEPFRLPADSMSPNANRGDYLLAQKFAYNFQTPIRGDVIIFTVGSLSYIKRVVGIPGDKIQMKNSALYINDVAVASSQIEDYSLPDKRGTRSIHQFVETLPEGKKVTILDEVRNGAFDNTPIYTVPARQYFVLGDNRDNSHDSRDQVGFGFISEENITGKASVILWNDRVGRLDWKPVN